MNLKYKYLGYLLLMIVVTAVSCKKDLLDTEPLGRYTPDNFPYPSGGSAGYAQRIFAAYAELRQENLSAQGFLASGSIRSDDAYKGSTISDAAPIREFDDFTTVPTNGWVNNTWVGYYSLINKANIVIDTVKTDLETPDAQKKQIEAEARFLRGYAYFHLGRVFGRVPISDTVFVNISQTNILQSDQAAVYAFAEKDLQFAAENLPLTWDKKYVGRATKGAAYGILAKLYLYQKKWAQAMTATSAVINSGIYDLNTPYAKIFGEDGENCSESIFEVQCTADKDHPMDANYGSAWARTQGVRGAVNTPWDMGLGLNTPSDELVRAYEDGDPRKARTIMDTSKLNMYGELVPSVSKTHPVRYNQKTLTAPSWRIAVGNYKGFWMNIRLLRYADVVLMYAEAANELGNTNEALAKLEMVRFRARNGNNAILPKVTTTDQDLLRKAIWQERRIELAMENERFFDIVRWGIAKDVLHAAGKTNYTVGKHEFYPIPQAQLDLAKGKLTQNPGY